MTMLHGCRRSTNLNEKPPDAMRIYSKKIDYDTQDAQFFLAKYLKATNPATARAATTPPMST